MATASHGQNAVPVELSPDPAFCIKSRVLPHGHKLFVNICHDPAIPPTDASASVVLGERRDGTDKGEPLHSTNHAVFLTRPVPAGQPCIIFDAIFNPDLCAKAAQDAELRRTIIEISLVRIEQATGFKLSRTIGTPNIKSKGPIPPRIARIPAFWATRSTVAQQRDEPTTPTWSWAPTRDGCQIIIKVPDLTKDLYEISTLDIEARRLIFTVGSRYHLDTPLLPPAGTKPRSDAKPVGGAKFLPTTVDPDSAVAQWSVKNKEISIAIKWASVAEREREKAKVA